MPCPHRPALGFGSPSPPPDAASGTGMRAARRPGQPGGRPVPKQPGLTAAAPEISWKESRAFKPYSKAPSFSSTRNPQQPITYLFQERIVITPARPSREDTELFHGE